jgi:hypothetical protein
MISVWSLRGSAMMAVPSALRGTSQTTSGLTFQTLSGGVASGVVTNPVISS